MTDAPQFRPEGGYSSLLTALAAALPSDKIRIQLQSVVREVRWQPGEVTVSGTRLGQPFTAKAARCIVALPLGVLQASKGPGAVRFSPPLKNKRAALQGLASGPVIKVLLSFRQAFWEEIDEGRYRDAAFLHAPGHDFPTFWTSLPLRVPLLVAWAGGPDAARLSALGSLDKGVTCALETLKAMFGGKINPADHLNAAYAHDWQRDPFARGAYSYLTTGDGTAREQLAEPLERTLFFAGEATQITGEAATVTGALLSAERAAREALE